MKLSEHFTLDEFTHSEWAARHGVDNKPTDSMILANLQDLALEMERIRTLLNGHPIIINSAYRSPKVNSGIGGAKTSAHLKGLACDFTCPSFGSPYEVAHEIAVSGLLFDQLILEYGWVHLGFAELYSPLRRQIMTKRSAKSPYEEGLIV